MDYFLEQIKNSGQFINDNLYVINNGAYRNNRNNSKTRIR